MDESTTRRDAGLAKESSDGATSALSRSGSPAWDAPSPSASGIPTARSSRLPRAGFQVIALGALAVAIVMAFISANSIMAIWFEGRYVPIVRLAFALAVGGAAVAVILKLAERNP